MMEFGKALRAAREAKGLSVAQLAEQTHLAPITIEDLENGNVKHIAAPIYGRGFVRLYCEAVGLEAKPFVNEFMEIMNGNREPVIKERPVAAPPADAGDIPAAIEPPTIAPLLPADEPLSIPNTEPIAEPPPQLDLLRGDRFAKPGEPPLADAPDPLRQPEPHDTNRSKQTITRYAAPLRSLQAAAPTAWRIGVLAIAAFALLALLVLGLRALRHATAPASPTAEAAKTVSRPAKPVAKADLPTTGNTRPAVVETREPQAIPALYLD